MFDRGTLLLAAIIYMVHSQVAGAGVKPLNMTLNVLDDLYGACHEEAMKKFIPDLLEQELNSSKSFQKAWCSNSQCPLIPGGTKDHTTALSVLHFGGPEFLKELDEAVETMGANFSTYKDNFHFKSLHFLLADSMRLLNPNKTCKTVFTILEEKEDKPLVGTRVRFSGFTVVHSDFRSLGDVEEETILSIKSCFYVDLDDHICEKNILETLISPAEVFTVDSVNHGEFTEVNLSHQGLNSTHDCYMFPSLEQRTALFPITSVMNTKDVNWSAAVSSTRSVAPLLVASLLCGWSI